jgi:hypothetical protein
MKIIEILCEGRRHGLTYKFESRYFFLIGLVRHLATVTRHAFVHPQYRRSICAGGRNPDDFGKNDQVEYAVVFNPRFVGGFLQGAEQVIDIFVATHKTSQYHSVNPFAEVISSQNAPRYSCMPQRA